MSEKTRRKVELARQIKSWPEIFKGAEQGNPFATLCDHCYGRHAPPRGILCPHASNSTKEESDE